MRKRVLLGMSGGVDSSVAAILLKEQGYEVIGATMNLWEIDGKNTSSMVVDAKKVCKKLDITHYVFDFQNEFKNHVIDNFIHCYESCTTPNPCIECNKYLKFGVFYKKAMELNCDYISTGHYAKVEYSNKYRAYILKKSNSIEKDQTYFLYGISKEVLPKVILPLENCKDKEIVRKKASEYGLEVAKKKDSQEVCFIPDNDYRKFLKKDNQQKTGNIVLNDGTIIGRHNGLINYTIGQRKGLGISYKEPLYVIKLNKKKNEIIVGKEQDLYSSELYADELNFLLDVDLSKEIEITAKIRFKSKEAKAKLIMQENQMAKVIFESPQRAITKGQSVVFYKDDIVLGGGKII